MTLEVWLNGETRDASGEGHAHLTGGAPLADAELAALTAYLHAAFPAQ